MLGSGVFMGKRYATETYKSAEARAEKAWEAEMSPARAGKVSYPQAVRNATAAWDKVMGNAVPDTDKAEV